MKNEENLLRNTLPKARSLKFLNRVAARALGKVPLSSVLIVSCIVQIIGTAGLVGYLSFRNGQQAVNDLATQLRREIGPRIFLYLENYLSQPHLINRINADAVRLGELDIKDLSKLERHLFSQLLQFDKVDSVMFASDRGDLRVATRSGGTLQNLAADSSAPDKIYVYGTDSVGNRNKLLQVRDSLEKNARNRPWYRAAVEAGKPVWSPIFTRDAKEEMALNATRPIYDRATGKLLGVFSVDINLQAIAQFLSQVPGANSGEIFIMEPSGWLIASASREPLFEIEGNRIQRRKAANSSAELIRTTANYLKSRKKFFNIIETRQDFQFIKNGRGQFVEVLRFGNDWGLNWLIVIVVPESDTEQIAANNRTTIGLCIAACFGSACLAILSARWITEPIFRLNAAAQSLAKGNWEKSLEIESFSEVRQLANSFNVMAKKLQNSLAEMRALNETLSASESRLNQFLEAIPVGVTVHEASGEITYANQAARRLLGKDIISLARNGELAEAYRLYIAGTDNCTLLRGCQLCGR